MIEGEGSFCASVKRQLNCHHKIQIDPEFFIYQHKVRRGLLELAQKVFAIGRIRPKGGNPNVLVYKVTRTEEIVKIIIPFLEKYMIYSYRKNDIEKFKQVAQICYDNKHLSKEQLIQLINIAYSMNMNG